MSARRVLILGAAGQVGRDLQGSFADFGEIVAAGRDAADFRPAALRVLPDSVPWWSSIQTGRVYRPEFPTASR